MLVITANGKTAKLNVTQRLVYVRDRWHLHHMTEDKSEFPEASDSLPMKTDGFLRIVVVSEVRKRD